MSIQTKSKSIDSSHWDPKDQYNSSADNTKHEEIKPVEHKEEKKETVVEDAKKDAKPEPKKAKKSPNDTQNV